MDSLSLSLPFRISSSSLLPSVGEISVLLLSDSHGDGEQPVEFFWFCYINFITMNVEMNNMNNSVLLNTSRRETAVGLFIIDDRQN